MRKNCLQCGSIYKGRNRNGREQKYCSKPCYLKANRKECVCIVCGEKFILLLSALDSGRCTGKYCSKPCYYKSRKGVRVAPQTEFKKGLIPKGGFKTRFKSGERHPLWKGGVSTEYEKLKQSNRYKRWRSNVYARDLWSCQICGEHCKPKNIIAHHIKPFADYPELRLEKTNGITLCRGCHLAVHNKIDGGITCDQVIYATKL